MELVYFYDFEGHKVMKKMMDEDFFKRLGPTVRDCRSMGFDKEGYFIYIKARDDLAEEAKKRLMESPVELLTGDEADQVVRAFQEESEAAEAGMGTLFG
jgi:hypothetical protein